MTERRIELLDPTVGPSTGPGTLSPRLDTLTGKTVGVIWNGRLPGDKIIDQLLGSLKTRYGIKEVVFRRKPYIGNIAPPEIIDELSAKCDAVITGVGD